MDSKTKTASDPNRLCINCREIESTHIILWLGAYVCSECADILQGQQSASDDSALGYPKVRIRKINEVGGNLVCQKFIDLGGNWLL